jgi:feruloyl esterase
MSLSLRYRLLLAILALAAAPHARADQCSDFLHQAPPAGVRLSAAASVAAGAAWSGRDGHGMEPVGAPFCRIAGTIEQEIGFELWLPPPQGWNGKLLQAGVGGEAGVLNYADMARGVRRGYASASTDTGHRIEDQEWALGRPDRRANFAARANHLLAEQAKALLAAYYGAPARHAYFVGCSGGGREGLKELQAYPEDFDGILAGGAGPDQLAVSMRLLWSQYVVAPRIESIAGPAAWKLVARAGVAACDARDGVRDGVVEDPAACGFDPATLRCRPGQSGDSCLTPAQLEAVRTLYAPLKDGSGKALDQGVLPGVEITLAPRSAFAFSLFGKVVHGDANWNPATLDIGRDHAAARAAWPDLPNDRTDIGAFRARGGKLIYYHGWMDPWILAQLPIQYFNDVNRRLGDTSGFFRLFMVPGMGHCRGGSGTDRFGGAGMAAPQEDAAHDMLAALEAWVEQGRAPERVVAARVDAGQVTRTRPLCPYPRQAVYTGHGSTDDAANFVCQTKETDQ